MSLWNQPPLKMMIDNKTQLNNSTEYDTLNAWILKLVFHRPSISLAYQINKITNKKMDWKIVTAWQLGTFHFHSWTLFMQLKTQIYD